MARFCAVGICLLAFASFTRAESGKWLAYTADHYGNPDVFVPEYPNYHQALPK